VAFKTLSPIAIGLALLAAGAVARATPIITYTGSTTDNGAIYNVTETVNGSNVDVILNVDTTGVNTTEYLYAAALKLVSQSSSISSLLSVSSPYSSSFTEPGGTNSSGCDGAGNGFFCTESTSHPGVHVGSVDTFEWTFNVANPSLLFTGGNAASLKAVYEYANGNFAAQTSNDLCLSPGTPPSPIPEPSSLVFLGTGLLGMLGAIKARYGKK
jgi:hypothetical protein